MERLKEYKSINLIKNGLSRFSPILLGIRTPTYKLARFLVPILSDKTQNQFTVKDSFTFADEISTENS